MFKISSMIFSLALIAYLAWSFIPNHPHERLDRACKPVEWTENIVMSATAFIAPEGQTSVENTFETVDYACEYTLWRLFYEADYKESTQNGDA